MAIFTHFIRMWTRSSGRCKIIGTGCVLGRAPRTKETMSDFHEWCWVTRRPRVFRGLTGCQRDTPVLRRHKYNNKNNNNKKKIKKQKKKKNTTKSNGVGEKRALEREKDFYFLFFLLFVFFSDLWKPDRGISLE